MTSAGRILAGLLFGLIMAAGGLTTALAPALAHEVRPGLLQIESLGSERFDITLRQPQRDGRWLAIAAALPDTCTDEGLRARDIAPAAVTERWTVACAGGLRGAEIALPGLERTLTDVFVRITLEDGTTISGLVKPDAPVFRIDEGAPKAGRYFDLGVWHILVGLDHILFVVLLVLLIGASWRLVKAVTAFTVAHSLTLGASALGVVGLPQRPVEVIIALSIVFLAYEVRLAAVGRETVSMRAPWLAAFAFGLLHGFGFAGVLTDLGLPPDARIEALLLFNLGVEAGQLAIVAAAIPALALARRVSADATRWAATAAATLIGGIAVFWVLERLIGVPGA